MILMAFDHRIALLCGVGLAIASCQIVAHTNTIDGGDAGSTHRKPICDGSSGLRLIVQQLSSAGRTPPGEQPMVENGFPLLLVDGKCHYWAYADTIWSPTRTGILSDEAAKTLAVSLSYEKWDEYSGQWSPQLTVYDAPTVVFTAPQSGAQVVCADLCGAGLTDAGGIVGELSMAVTRFKEIASELSTSGADVDGGVRYIFIARENLFGEPWLAWPTSIGIGQDQAISKSDSYTLEFGDPRVRLAQGEQASALRALRILRTESGDFHNYDSILLRDQADAGFALYFRDDLPFENGSGLIAP